MIDLEPSPPATATPTLTPTVTAVPTAPQTPQPVEVRLYLPDVCKTR